MLHKHAPNTMGMGMLTEVVINEGLKKAGLGYLSSELPSSGVDRDFDPVDHPCIFRSVLISAHRSETIIKNPIIQGVGLTGSVGAGRSV